MTDADADPFGPPEADYVEQQIPTTPEAADGIDVPVAPLVEDAQEADVLEQARPLQGDDEDYPRADSADREI